VDEPPVAEVLPGLYRAVLDAIAALEAINRRAEATAIRSEAIRVYSRAWTPAAARRLRALRTRADRIGAVRGRTRYEPNGRTTSPPTDLEHRTA
jgi:hypothetical protein